MKRALITGVAGFAGSHLAAHLLSRGWGVSGIERPGAPCANLDGIGPVRVEKADILDAAAVGRAVADVAPDAVFHLAAVTFLPSVEDSPREALDVNAGGTLVLLEACRRHAPAARFILASSSEVYGKVPPEGMPVREDRRPAPANVYAFTKLCAEEAVRFYARAHGLSAVVLRPFNHIGPRQAPSFVASSFARQVAEIEAGMKEPVVSVGNLDAERDFTDVRDMVRAYALAAERCAPGGIYNIGAGRPLRVGRMLEMLIALSSARIEVRRDPARLRKSDTPVLYGDSAKFAAATGWRPEHPIEETLRLILDWWRARVAARA